MLALFVKFDCIIRGFLSVACYSSDVTVCENPPCYIIMHMQILAYFSMFEIL